MKKQALDLHHKLMGKISINSKISLKSKDSLSLAYTPGVAEAVREISEDKMKVYDLTIKNNTLAVVSDGSAVLGLGNVGAEAALPVMEGKCAIFKEFADINAFPICLNTQNSEDIIKTIKYIAPVFGGINLEDISAPRCFEIEESLIKELSIPVMHDDQHATAIVVLAGLFNATKIVNKSLSNCRVVINGVGAAGSAICSLLSYYGVKNIILVDSLGIINNKRKNIDIYKNKLLKLINNTVTSGNLSKAAEKADIIIGVSQKDLFTEEIVTRMNKNPIVFALANPAPEVTEKDAIKWGTAVYANGRSDCTNQINNALVFPGFFKGLLKYRIRNISMEMKVNAALAISSLVSMPTQKFFMPSILNKKLVKTILASFK